MFQPISVYKKWIKSSIILFIIFSLLLTVIHNYGQGFSKRNKKVAEVGDIAITDSFFQESLARFFEKIKENPHLKNYQNLSQDLIKHKVLEEIINEQILKSLVSDFRFSISDRKLREFISSLDLGDGNNNFSEKTYSSFLKNHGVNPIIFESQQRNQLSINKFLNSISAAVYIPNIASSFYSSIFSEKRLIKILTYKLEDFWKLVDVTYEDALSFYEENQDQFISPETIDARFIVLDKKIMLEETEITESDVLNFYQKNKENFLSPETRSFRQIFIKKNLEKDYVDSGATYQRIQNLHKLVLENPGIFSSIAFENSEDDSSWDGGILGNWNLSNLHEIMEPHIADLIFKLEKNQVSEIVESSIGFHIFQVTEIYPKISQTFQESKEQIRNELSQEKVDSHFSIKFEKIAELKSKEYDLDLIAKLLDLRVFYLKGFTKNGLLDGLSSTDFYDPELLDSEIISKTLFKQGKLKNSECKPIFIDVSPNATMFFHVEKLNPISVQPFEEVKECVYDLVRRVQSIELVKARGERILDELRSGKFIEDINKFSSLFEISKFRVPTYLPKKITDFVMSIRADFFPFYSGIMTDEGFSIIKLERVESEEVNETIFNSFKKQLESVIWNSEVNAILDILKEKYKVKIFRN